MNGARRPEVAPAESEGGWGVGASDVSIPSADCKPSALGLR